nr:cerebellin-2-like [Cherax quadricarinatus]XP_053637296.1 cerebellin-2-like [Cherax quadricarinatus]
MTAGSVFTSHHPTPAADLLSREVAFSVQKVTNTFHAVTRVHFRDVLTNIGGCWDPITSEFVAPYNGGYYFIFHVLGARHSDFTMTLMKNGVYQVTAYGTEKTFETASNSAFLELRRLDKIWLMLQQGSIDEHPGNETYNTFAGFLMFPL